MFGSFVKVSKIRHNLGLVAGSALRAVTKLFHTAENGLISRFFSPDNI